MDKRIDGFRFGNGGRGGDAELTGQLLIALPGMGDGRFVRSVIYLHTHSRNGAMGFIINREMGMKFEELMVRLGVKTEAQAQSALTVGRKGRARVRYGGPVEEERGFVLHSPEYHARGDAHGGPVSVSSSMETLHAIARGEGPEKSVLVLGYAGWSAGQLEGEISENAWLNGPADAELVFNTPVDEIYDRALLKIGVRPEQLSGASGHA
ncbi:MAG: YqgE/AlgH family protein [Rhizobiaceae bacterium]|jgi:putative transcriptional regulator|nr:YqgE/AlgH family protein [Rhizobiaceae bacterium]